jgi:hypothetical protein
MAASLARPPASVTVPAGSTSASVLMKAAQFSSIATVVLTASPGGVSMQATVKAEPVKSDPTSAGLQAISASTQQVRPGDTFNLIVQQASPAPAGGAAVQLPRSQSDVRPPASVIVPAGSRSAIIQARVGTGAPSWIVFLSASSTNTVATYIIIRSLR